MSKELINCLVSKSVCESVRFRFVEAAASHLKKTEKMSNEKFVPFLFKNFPPKHKVGVKEPPVSQTQ